jgi:hypothetical protein
VLFVVEAVHAEAADAVRAAGDDLAELVARHLPSATVERWSVEPHSG